MRFSAIFAAVALAVTVNAAAVDNVERDALAEADFDMDDIEMAIREAEAEPENALFARANCGALARKVPACAVRYPQTT